MCIRDSFWSMRLEAQDSNKQMTFAKKDAVPNRVMLEGVIDGLVVASSELLRNFQAGETQTRDLKIGDDSLANGLGTGDTPAIIGKLFIPSGLGPHPVIVVLSGTGGGFDLDKAAVLSGHGLSLIHISLSRPPAAHATLLGA